MWRTWYQPGPKLQLLLAEALAGRCLCIQHINLHFKLVTLKVLVTGRAVFTHYVLVVQVRSQSGLNAYLCMLRVHCCPAMCACCAVLFGVLSFTQSDCRCKVIAARSQSMLFVSDPWDKIHCVLLLTWPWAVQSTSALSISDSMQVQGHGHTYVWWMVAAGHFGEQTATNPGGGDKGGRGGLHSLPQQVHDE